MKTGDHAFFSVIAGFFFFLRLYYNKKYERNFLIVVFLEKIIIHLRINTSLKINEIYSYTRSSVVSILFTSKKIYFY